MIPLIKRILGQIKRDDGYDSEGKSEQDGKERHAREDIRKSVLADAFSEPTRRARRSLLAVSVLVLVINARLPIEKIPYIGEPPSEQSILAVLGLLSVGLLYFLVVFIASAGYEYSRWRLDGNITLLNRTMDWHQAINDMCFQMSQFLERETQDTRRINTVHDLREKAQTQLPDIAKRVDRTENYYVSTSHLQMWRMIVLDLALPLIISLAALTKVYKLVAPMIADLVTA